MPDNPILIPKDWYHLSFDSLYPVVYAHRTVEAAREDALFSIQETKLTRADRVLDLCCGNGRHMATLVEAADMVVGLDYSSAMLDLARGVLGPKGLLVRADMRAQPFEECFDVVVNYFTSFGYFETEEENLAAVRGLSKALRPGGRFFIDYFNRSYTEQNIEPSSVRFQDGYEIREERWIDLTAHRINKTTVVLREGVVVSDSGESVRLYSDAEFRALLSAGGLHVERIFGDYMGGECCVPTQPRMIVIGRKA